MTDSLRHGLGRLWLLTEPRLRLLRHAMTIDAATYDRIVEARLSSVVHHAYVRSPGWRRRIDASGLLLSSGSMRERLLRLAPLEREDLQRHGQTLLSDDLHERRWYRNSSGGSTGEPVEVVQDVSYLRWARATKALFDLWSGYEPGQAKLVLWGAHRDLAAGSSRRRIALRWLKNERWLDAYRFDGTSFAHWTAQLEHHHPVQLLGYAESLDLWARALLDDDQRTTPPGAVMTTAGVLTPQMRSSIERAFGAPVFDRYGSREVGDIAGETAAHDGLAIPPFHVHVELLDPDGAPVGPGGEGDVVVTSLSNLAMPLIRYRLGDRARWADLQPGTDLERGGTDRPLPEWPRLASVSGRRSEHLVCPDGSLLHVGAIRTALYAVRGVDAYQLVQTAPDRLVLRVEARSLPVTVENELRSRISDGLANSALQEASLEVERADRLDRGETGKLRTAVPLPPLAPPR